MNYKTEKIKKAIPFITASRRMKNLGINSTNKESTLKTRTLMKETEDTNRKIFHAHGLEELILFKCPYYPKQLTDALQSLSKLQWHFSQK